MPNTIRNIMFSLVIIFVASSIFAVQMSLQVQIDNLLEEIEDLAKAQEMSMAKS